MSVRTATESVHPSGLLDLVDTLAARPGDVASPLTGAGATAAGASLCLCLCVALPTT